MPSLRDTTRKFGFRVALPATLVLVGTLATVIFSLSRMADQTNRIEDELTRRSVGAAVQTFVRRVGESHGDYAQWDDAVRSLYGTVDQDFVRQNFVASTATPTFFDTVFVLDENDREVFAYRAGEALTVTARAAFGPALDRMIGRVPRDGRTYGRESGLVTSRWGLMALAVGPIVANTPNLANPPARARLLLIARTLDEAAVKRLGEDFVIDGMQLRSAAAADALPLQDPGGATIGWLGWSPRQLGSEAHAAVSPTLFVMLALLVVTMAVLMVVAARGIREISRREVESRHAATHDALTGLPNRTALIHGLEAAIAAKRVAHVPFVLVYLDLDGFKDVNDAYGHEAGDRLLRQVADRFNALSDEHLLARLGGDEFALLVTGIDAKKVATIFGRSAIELLKLPFDIESRRIIVGTSIGVAAADEPDLTAEELLRRSDVAMYHAKQQGPNRTFVYDALIDKLRHERIELANDLRRAMGKDELTVAYQPVIDARTRQIVAAEALLRWNHPKTGEIPPSIFIAIAEETGLIAELGNWALRRACEEALPWSDIRLSVNVSPAQFRNPHFEATVASVLRETGFPASRLELEVTETYFIAQPEQARTAIEALHAIGVSVALDDFGTGYSSIGYLRRFKFDKLKLDRSVIDSIVTDQEVQRLVQATIGLADALGLTVTAEGVETEDEAILLRAAGCDELQGYLFARPGTPRQFADRLKHRPVLVAEVAALSA
jgi:diguanylate cyclase (GGDEF)-like protein